MNFTILSHYLIDYGFSQKIATYRGYDKKTKTHIFWDGQGIDGTFGFSEIFIKSRKIKITELIDE